MKAELRAELVSATCIIQVSQQTLIAHDVTNGKTEVWTETLTFCDSSQSQPIRGPGRSKCIMGGGRSLVAAQIYCQNVVPLWDLWLKGSKWLAIIIPSQMPVSTPPPAPNTTTTRLPRPTLQPSHPLHRQLHKLQETEAAAEALYCVE